MPLTNKFHIYKKSSPNLQRATNVPAPAPLGEAIEIVMWVILKWCKFTLGYFQRQLHEKHFVKCDA
jgi:hypothetical protein